MRKIYGRWETYPEMQRDWFSIPYNQNTNQRMEYTFPASFPTIDELLFASYGGNSYLGDAIVIWKRDGKLYENVGGHCSCYGLQDQWEPEETSVSALAKRDYSHSVYLCNQDPESVKAYWDLVARLGEK